MPQMIQTEVFTFDELDEEAREEARAWYRRLGLDPEAFDAVIEDFERVCECLGVRLATRTVRLMGGGTREVAVVHFCGFGSQGDGASFAGDWGHVPGAKRRLRAFAPRDAELHAIADRLQAVQRRHVWQLHARVSLRGRHVHEHAMEIAVGRSRPAGQNLSEGAGEAVREALRDLARWLYRQLARENDWLMSDQAVDEALLANAYTFTREGRRFG